MNAKQFFDAVVKMRELQQSYYKTRSNIALMAAKKQEKIIDDEIKRVNDCLDKSRQESNLFGHAL